LNIVHGIVYGMRAQTCKTKIIQLVKVMGSRINVAEKLGVTERYIYYLEKGRKPGWRLYRDICNIYDSINKG